MAEVKLGVAVKMDKKVASLSAKLNNRLDLRSADKNLPALLHLHDGQ